MNNPNKTLEEIRTLLENEFPNMHPAQLKVVPEFILKIVTKSLTQELREKIEEMRVPDDWNKGDNTGKRYHDIVYRSGTMTEIYNWTLDDILSLLQEREGK